MSILSVIQNVCLAVGLPKPDVVMSSEDRAIQEVVRLASNMAIQIRDVEFDWQTLQAIHTITGDGIAEAFPLPDNYARMTTRGTLWSSRWSWGINQVSSLDEWLEMMSVPYVTVSGDWIIYGDEIHVMPVMAAPETVRFTYITDEIVKKQDGSKVSSFMADTDVFRLCERTLELAVVWAYRDQKGVASDTDEEEYRKALYAAMNRDKGSKPVISGNSRRFDDARPAFPYKVTP